MHAGVNHVLRRVVDAVSGRNNGSDIGVDLLERLEAFTAAHLGHDHVDDDKIDFAFIITLPQMWASG